MEISLIYRSCNLTKLTIASGNQEQLMLSFYVMFRF